MVIFFFLVSKYSFCVNLIQKFKKVILSLLMIGKSFQPEFETVYLCWFFYDLVKGVIRL